MVDLAHEREQEAKETMEALQNEITRLHELSGQGEALMAGRQDARSGTVLLHDVAQMRSQLETVNAKQDAVEAQRLELETKLESANAELQASYTHVM
ncbi:hypothetical protein FJT64_005669 [Amphibalanus amphitrite]|uniref:Uncharacterized protein n=1 Tax=Amphibalanus amphitrite TaxID=1232801 RepID=A0A6A4W4F7_AMPAM|nr:hypothetical protein FJT64_005669 [Amphibalanus amphitrite]